MHSPVLGHLSPLAPSLTPHHLENPSPPRPPLLQEGSWSAVSGDEFLRRLLSAPVAEAKFGNKVGQWVDATLGFVGFLHRVCQ